MKKEIADKWVAALRSGDYKQCKGHLKDSTGHCCLGVLSEISGIGEWESVEDHDYFIFKDGSTEKQVCGVTRKVLKWSGLKESLGEFKGGALYELNDRGLAFGGIADVIEEKWEEL